MPAGRVNKKKGSDATVAMSEMRTGEPVSRFIIHVAASLWAATKVPEITVAIQSLLKAGLSRALQVELLVIIPYKGIPFSEFHYYCHYPRTSDAKNPRKPKDLRYEFLGSMDLWSFVA